MLRAALTFSCCRYHPVSRCNSPPFSCLYHHLCPVCCFWLGFSQSLLFSPFYSSCVVSLSPRSFTLSLPSSYFSRSPPFLAFILVPQALPFTSLTFDCHMRTCSERPIWPFFFGVRRKSLTALLLSLSLVILTSPSLPRLCVCVSFIKAEICIDPVYAPHVQSRNLTFHLFLHPDSSRGGRGI